MSFQCTCPRLAIQKEEGAKPIFFRITNERDYEWYLKNWNDKGKLLLIPCGKCPNCVKRKSQEWTSRLLKEKENFKYCYFVTLTYDDKHLRDINKQDIQLFLKRYRKNFKLKCKYYITGEYGETSGRSHYHGIFFQDKPLKDLIFYANNLYVSDSFAKCWSLGNCLISKQVNEQSIKYTIAYTLKKLGESKVVMMSKGLGLAYLNEHKEEIKDHNGFYVSNGYKQRFPSYFTRKLKESSEPEDILYLLAKENEPKESRLLTGRTLGDLADIFMNGLDSKALKGKGEF